MIGWFRFSVKYGRIRNVLLTSNNVNLQIMIKTCYSLLALYIERNVYLTPFGLMEFYQYIQAPNRPLVSNFHYLCSNTI